MMRRGICNLNRARYAVGINTANVKSQRLSRVIALMNKVFFRTSNYSNEWYTPDDVYKTLDDEFHFKFDPCPVGGVWDGLYRKWESPTFCNPPYQRIKFWVKKAFDEWQEGVTSVLLIPSRTDTIWWHEYCMKATEIRFIKGRIKFKNATQPAPFPTCLIVFKANGKI